MSVAPKKIAVVLAGCGVFDGSEIHEAVCTLLNLAANGADYQCFAPDAPQPAVIDHRRKTPAVGESRNMLTEAARIARGNIKSLNEFKPEDFDAVIFPGGQGAAKNLCNFALSGAAAEVRPDVKKALTDAYAAGLPIGAICIAPALVALALGHHGITLTIGNDAATAAEIEKTGARHQVCETEGVCVDEQHRIVSTPAYMLASSVAEVNAGIARLVKEILRMC